MFFFQAKKRSGSFKLAIDIWNIEISHVCECMWVFLLNTSDPWGINPKKKYFEIKFKEHR